jgi:hypothetical protein
MSDESQSIAASAAGDSAASTTPNADTTVNATANTNPAESTATGTISAAPGTPGASATPAPGAEGAVPVIGAPAYTPNYKYKAAGQEKELDKMWHSLIKDADSEKKVKEVFAKVDAFEYAKQRREQAEQQVQSLTNDYQQVNSTVQRFNHSVQSNDLSSAFRLAGITKDQVFNWTKQQLQLMDMPPEQRQQHEQAEQIRAHNYDLNEKVQQLQQQYESQAVQARAVQLDVALSRPEVARFAEQWDQNAEQPGAFKVFVIEEAKKAYYDAKQDLSPEQAIQSVMQKFGKFLNVGSPTMQSPQAIPQSGQPRQVPVIPNVQGKAASPIKKVPKSLDELKALAKSL